VEVGAWQRGRGLTYEGYVIASGEGGKVIV
jgi:hypothetical protein